MADYTLTAKLTADSKSLEAGFKKAQDSLANIQSKTTNFGKNLKNIGRNISSFGDTLTRRITLPAAAATSALAGITLVKGFGRLTGIDTAQAKLKGLGHDAESVELIMVSALDSVKGTAFGMDEAVTTAASAVAAGIEPGKELTRYLTLTGDAAAIAGDSMADMGSIINKVQTASRAYTMDLNMLSDRGIPIYQWLADEAGTTADKVRDMASEGSISSEMFLSAIEKNIGGAAKTMGEESFMAGIANVGAAIGRLGANFLDAGGEAGGFFSTIKPMTVDAINFIDSLADKAQEAGVKFGEAFNNFLGKVKDLKARFDDLSPPVQSFILKATGIAGAFAVGIGPALKIVGMLTSGIGALASVVAFLMSPVGLAIVGIGLLVGAFTYLWNTSEEFRESFIDIWSKIQEVITGVIDFIVEFIMLAWGFLQDFWEEHGQMILETAFEIWNAIYETVMDLVTQVVDFVVHIWGMLVDFWNDHGQMIMDSVINVWTFIQPFVENYLKMIWNNIKTVFNFIKNFIQISWDMISGIFEGALNVIMGLVQFFSSLFTGNWTGMWDATKRIFGGALDILKSIVSGVFNNIRNVISTVMDVIKNKITNIWDNISVATSKVWDGIVGTIKGAINGVIRAINGMLGAIGKINIKLPKIPNWVPGLGGKGGGSIGFPSIPKIPQLQRGTDDWIGGFAYMNEGGRGELVHLPDGSQVVPHDVSMRYAREAGRFNSHAHENVTSSDHDASNPVPAVINLYVGTKKIASELVDDLTDLQDRQAFRQRRLPRRDGRA